VRSSHLTFKMHYVGYVRSSLIMITHNRPAMPFGNGKKKYFR